VSGGLTGEDDSSPCRSTLSYMDDWVDSKDAVLRTESGGEPETKATRLNSSDALLPGCMARAFGLALEVVMDGSVAVARSSRGLLSPRLRSEESLLCILLELDVAEAIMLCCCVAGLLS
jgi:hypothetical protein